MMQANLEANQAEYAIEAMNYTHDIESDNVDFSICKRADGERKFKTIVCIQGLSWETASTLFESAYSLIEGSSSFKEELLLSLSKR